MMPCQGGGGLEVKGLGVEGLALEGQRSSG